MTPPILFFAAGMGTRMWPLTRDLPKPLIKVGGTPLLDHARTLADQAGLTHQVINAHYKSDALTDHLAGSGVTISDETDLLRDTGGGLRHALPHLGSGPVITMNTDAIWSGPNPIRRLLSAWRDDMQALLLVINAGSVHGHKGSGDFTLDADGHITRAADLIYTGVQMIRPQTLNGIEDPVFSLNRVWDKLIAEKSLHGVIYDGAWCDVGQPESIPIAEALLNV